MKKQLAAMIFGLALVWPVFAQSGNAGSSNLPNATEFAVAMENGDVKKAQAWLDAGLPPDFMGSRIGSGLMIGAWEGNIELMRLFISRGADINRMNGNGETAILLAAWKNQKEAVQWLIDRGARINAGKRQWSPLHYAVFNGHKELASYLIGQGADINAQSTNGSSVLMMAIYEGHQDLAKELLEKGASPQGKNDWGEGALEWAMRFNHLQIARMITSPEEFNLAVAKPREEWGEPRRSLKMSTELEDLIRMRETLKARGASTKAVDSRIAAERARIVRSEFDKSATPGRNATLEITAKRKAPQEQSANVVYDADGKAAYKAPPATFYGTPKMPPKGNVKNY